jgi:hypothetical protein
MPGARIDLTVRTGDGVPRAFAEGDLANPIAIDPLERLEIRLGEQADACGATWNGYVVNDGELTDLPVGASLDRLGTFYWQPGPGFLGRFSLLFIRTDCTGQEQKLGVDVVIRPSS